MSTSDKHLQNTSHATPSEAQASSTTVPEPDARHAGGESARDRRPRTEVLGGPDRGPHPNVMGKNDAGPRTDVMGEPDRG